MNGNRVVELQDCFIDQVVNREMIFKWIINEIGWEVMFWINLVEDSDHWWAVVNTVMHPLISENVANFLISRGPVSASGRALLHLVCKCNYSYSHREVGGEGDLMRSFMIRVLLTKYYSGHHIKNNEMGGTCGMYERQELCIQDFGGDT